jgi:hypothetical protein
MPTIAAATPGADTTALAGHTGIPASAAVVSNTTAIDLLTIEILLCKTRRHPPTLLSTETPPFEH